MYKYTHLKKNRFTHHKKHKSRFTGVYPIADEKWEVRLTVKGVKYIHGPFDDEEDAAKVYDRERFRFSDGKSVYLNFPDHYPLPKKKEKTKPKKLVRSDGGRKESRTKKRRRIDGWGGMPRKKTARKKFPPQARIKVACRQGWLCNFCGNRLDEAFIIDHMLPLMCQGSNDPDNNIQAICSSCNRYKTTIFDYQVLMPLAKKEKLTAEKILKLQEEKYWEMMCISPPNVSNQFKPHCCISNRVKDVVGVSGNIPTPPTVLAPVPIPSPSPSPEKGGFNFSLFGLNFSYKR